MPSTTLAAATSPQVDPYQLRGRVAVVTGAGQGLGRAFAKAFAAAGATAVIADINGETGPAVAREVAAAGGKALAIGTDVADARSVDQMAARVLDELGRIDVLINNAGFFSTLKMRPFDQIPLDEWDHTLRVNVTGMFLCARAVVPTMRKAGYGRIVNLSSATARFGRPNYLHYVTSKAAVVGLTRALARELGEFGITVNAIQPGATFTEIPRETVSPAQKEQIIATQCIKRAETPDDLVGMVLFLSSSAASFVTGQTIAVDGGTVLR